MTHTPPVSDEAVRDVIRRMNIRQIWKDNGGGFHGPHIEHAYIEDRKFDAVISAIVIAVLSHAAAPFMRGGDGMRKALEEIASFGDAGAPYRNVEDAVLVAYRGLDAANKQGKDAS